MHETWLARVVSNVSHFRITGDERVGYRIDLVGVERMTRHAGLLVDHDEILVFEQDPQAKLRVGDRKEGAMFRQLSYRNYVASFYDLTLFCASSVNAHQALFCQLGRALTTQSIEMLNEEHVETRARFLIQNREFRCRHARRVARLPLRCQPPYNTRPMSTAVKRDYYEVLEVSRDASAEDLKRAYKKCAMRYHPDKNPGDVHSEEMFKACSEAYAILSDPDKRQRYDRVGHAGFGGAHGGPGFEQVDFGSVSDLLEGLFGEVFRGARGGNRKSARIGADIQVDLEISFEEAALGAEKTISVTRNAACEACDGSGALRGTSVETCSACAGQGEVRFQRGFFASMRPCSACGGRGKKIPTPCTTCHGTGARIRSEEMTVKVPAGVAHGAVRTMRGAGERGVAGSGDLHVHVNVRPHSIFKREGADVLCTIPVSFPQVALGDQIDVPTLEGKVKMRLPNGTQSGKVFRLRGKGLPVFGGYGKGDQLVEVIVEVPEQLTPKQRAIVEELARELGTESQPQRQSFIDKLKKLFDA